MLNRIIYLLLSFSQFIWIFYLNMLFPDMFLSILVFSLLFIFSIIVPVILDAFDLAQFDSTIPLTYIIGFITIRYKRIYIPENMDISTQGMLNLRELYIYIDRIHLL